MALLVFKIFHICFVSTVKWSETIIVVSLFNLSKNRRKSAQKFSVFLPMCKFYILVILFDFVVLNQLHNIFFVFVELMKLGNSLIKLQLLIMWVTGISQITFTNIVVCNSKVLHFFDSLLSFFKYLLTYLCTLNVSSNIRTCYIDFRQIIMELE